MRKLLAHGVNVRQFGPIVFANTNAFESAHNFLLMVFGRVHLKDLAH